MSVCLTFAGIAIHLPTTCGGEHFRLVYANNSAGAIVPRITKNPPLCGRVYTQLRTVAPVVPQHRAASS